MCTPDWQISHHPQLQSSEKLNYKEKHNINNLYIKFEEPSVYTDGVMEKKKLRC